MFCTDTAPFFLTRPPKGMHLDALRILCQASADDLSTFVLQEQDGVERRIRPNYPFRNFSHGFRRVETSILVRLRYPHQSVKGRSARQKGECWTCQVEKYGSALENLCGSVLQAGDLSKGMGVPLERRHVKRRVDLKKIPVHLLYMVSSIFTRLASVTVY